VSLPKPHQCYTPARQFWDRYDEAKLSLPPNAEADPRLRAPHFRRTWQHWRTGKWQLFEPTTFEAGRLRKLHGYLGNVSHVDHAVGELLAYLDDTGLAEETVVVYSSDHGDYATEHGIMEKAPGICSDAITRIPMIWRWPGRLRAGHEATELVETVDFATTICALTGVETLETSDGKDLSHLLLGERGQVRRAAFTEFAWSKSIRMGDFRLVYYPPEMFRSEHPEGFGELYDLGSDPWEMRNLFFETRMQGKVEEMRAELLSWLVTTTRPTTVHPVPNELTAQRVSRYQHAVNADGKQSPQRLKSLATLNYL
jgi:choline-sulfatase/uncharacterized sulfatase